MDLFGELTSDTRKGLVLLRCVLMKDIAVNIVPALQS